MSKLFIVCLFSFSTLAFCEYGIGWDNGERMLALETSISSSFRLNVSGTAQINAYPNASKGSSYVNEFSEERLSGKVRCDLLFPLQMKALTLKDFSFSVAPFARLQYEYSRTKTQSSSTYDYSYYIENSVRTDVRRRNSPGIAFGIRPEFRFFNRFSLLFAAGVEGVYNYEEVSESLKLYDYHFDAGFFSQGFGLNSVSLMVWF